MELTSELLNAAYYARKATFPDKVATREQLKRYCPGFDPAALDETHARVEAFITKACAWADQRRGPKNDFTGIPTLDLAKECPGFSALVYEDACGWGFLLTR